jgi:alpha-beta hydrolase superfamily lysophospholipase
VRSKPHFTTKILSGSYNKHFRPNRTTFDWLNRDEKEVDSYIDDSLSVKLCSYGFYRDIGRALKNINSQEAMAKINPDLPVYVISGSADAVGDMGVSPTELVDAYRSLGIKDLEFVLYPGARHEILNETNREEVIGNLFSWIERHCDKNSEDAS